MILDQEDRDNAVRSLLEKVSDVYKFMNEDGRLIEIPTMQELYGKMARQTLECADFIVHYSETKSECESSALYCHSLTFSVVFFTGKRLTKNVLKETTVVIRNYSNALDALMQQFRDNAACSTVLKVYRIGKSWLQIHSNLN